MTKEELRTEAEEYLTKLLKRLKISKEDLAENQPEFLDLKKMNIISLNVSNVSKAYLASAEPREKRIAELEKENGELKEKLEILTLVGNVATKGLDKQLSKAKEIIKELLKALDGRNGFDEDIFGRAEQFLKEK